MSIEAHGARKYRNSNLLLSSEGRGWRAITAELRQHSACEISPITPASTELTIAIRGHHGGFVRRKGAGLRQETRAASGSIWITPIAVTDNQIQLTAAIPEVLHLYLSEQGLNTLTDGYDLPQVGTLGVRYLAGIQDDMIRHIGLAILVELTSETATGALLVDTLALSLTARLGQTCSDIPFRTALRQHQCLGNNRLRRVLEYIQENLETEMTTRDLAGVACLSPFHFTRLFANTTGMPPHRYISQQRLERAKQLLTTSESSLADIALTCCFSSQANFTRAFRRVTGNTPAEYRRHHSPGPWPVRN